MKFRKSLLCIVALLIAAPALAQMNAARGTAQATINAKQVTINYGQPSLRGRDMLSEAQTGMVWRLGMNQATTIESAGDLVVAGKTLPAGKYTLWAKKTGDKSWVLAFHPKTENNGRALWGQPELTEGYVAELPLKLATAKAPVEQLTISLADMKNGNAGVKIEWGTAVLTGSFKVK